jgi:hypothetical protein
MLDDASPSVLTAALTIGADQTATLSKLALAATSTDSIVLQNTTASIVTGGLTVQMSPRTRWSGTGWDSDDNVSRTVSFFAEVLPASANTVTGSWKLGYISAAGATTYPMSVSSSGAISGGSFTVSGNATVGAAGEVDWDTRMSLVSPSSGVLSLRSETGLAFGRLNYGPSTNAFSALSARAANGLELLSAAGTSTWNDPSTAAQATLANRTLFGVSIDAAPTLTATNANTYNGQAALFSLPGVPVASTNVSIGVPLIANLGNVLRVGATYATLADPATLAAESLTNPNLTSGTSWTAAGGFALATDAATFTSTGTTAGTLTQASGTLAIAVRANRLYAFTYTISTPTGTAPVLTITTGVAATAVRLGSGTAGTYTIYFRSAASPGNFVLDVTSTATGAFTIDSLTLKEVAGGDFYAGGNVYAAGIQTDALTTWSLGVVTTAAAVLDATRYVNVVIGGVPYKLAIIQ